MGHTTGEAQIQGDEAHSDGTLPSVGHMCRGEAHVVDEGRDEGMRHISDRK